MSPHRKFTPAPQVHAFAAPLHLALYPPFLGPLFSFHLIMQFPHWSQSQTEFDNRAKKV
jgi:hypothetical protein